MGRSDILTEELRNLLIKIEDWLNDIYIDKVRLDTTKLDGDSLKEYNEFISGITESMVMISSVLRKGYYTTEEREVLNLLRNSWIEEKKRQL